MRQASNALPPWAETIKTKTKKKSKTKKQTNKQKLHNSNINALKHFNDKLTMSYKLLAAKGRSTVMVTHLIESHLLFFRIRKTEGTMALHPKLLTRSFKVISS
jgi:ribulose 1,5-bisphosphate carboxylase large subunit-like protein